MNAPRLVFASSLLLAATSCGDNLCPEVFVAITSPTDAVSGDQDVNADGVQTDIRVRSSLREGDTLTLTVVDESGAAAGTHQATSDSAGNATFDDITVPTGSTTLRVSGSSGCDSDSDEIQVLVGNSACMLSIREGSTQNDFYKMMVVNTTQDTDADSAGFQGTIDVQTLDGYQVEVFVLNSGTEASLGSAAADAAALASLAVTLNQGQNSLRAVCRGSTNESSVATVVYVDTEAPACTLEPAEGTTIIPALDTDGNSSNGTQISLVGSAPDDDVEGEPASFTFDAQAVSAPTLDASGNTTATVSFDDDNQSGWNAVFTAQDHADNVCTIERTYTYQPQGCLIAITDPVGAITTDANGDDNDGVQYDLVVTVSAECAGQTVTTDCDAIGPQSGVVPVGGGAVTIPVTLCESAECDETIDCVANVTDPANFTTTDGAALAVDTKPPFIQLLLLQPNSLACGQQIDASADYNNVDPGVQIRVRANDLGQASARSIAFTPPGGSETSLAVDAITGQADVTLQLGANAIAAVATDINGNIARGPVPDCIITLADIAVDFDSDIADGSVGANDGSVAGSDLTLDICGTVSRADITVLVSVDGGGTQSATVTGTDWCLNGVTLSEGDHSVTATAIDGGASGANTIDPLTVDLTAPDAPTGPLATIINRQEASFQWTAPEDSGPTTPASSYTVKIATVQFTEGNFSATGMEMIAPTPSTPGATDSSSEVMLRAGTDYYFAVAAWDDAGNRSTVAATSSALRLSFAETGAVGPTLVSQDFGWHQLGAAVTGGDFNGDGYGDLAVGAPGTDLVDNSPDNFADGVVYVYLGKTDGTGLDTDPAFIVKPITSEVTGQFGAALTTMRWNSDNVDDLVVGAPFQDDANGRVTVFFGGTTFDPGAMATPIDLFQDVDGDIDIESDGSGTFFAAGRLGFSLATARFDSSDNRDDLVIGVAAANQSRGGALILFGGTTEFGTDDARIVLSDSDAGEMGELRVYRMTFAGEPNGSTYGDKIVNLGRTQGTTDATDDIAVSPYTTPVATPNRFYVFRGRTARPAVGITDLAFNASVDLSVTDETDLASTSFAHSVGTVADLNSDGAREILVSDWRGDSLLGYVSILDGNAVGAQTVGGIEIARITGNASISNFGSAIVNNQSPGSSDVDGDGQDDLVIVGNAGATDNLYVWYGGQIPSSGTVTAQSTFDYGLPEPTGVNFTGAETAAWIGDVNGDGLSDLVWADDSPGGFTGAFEVLWK